MRRGRNCTPVGLRLGRFAPFVLLLALIGCVPEPAFDNDPLLGNSRPIPRNGALGAPASAVAAAPKPPVAPFAPVSSTSAVSPAALAAGSPPADSSPLRIGQPPANPAAPGALTAAPHEGWQGTAPAAGVTLQQPQIASDPAARPIAVIAPPTAPATAPSQYEALQDLLTKHGVLFQSLEGPDDHGVWRFSCGVPSRDQQGGVHRIELSAPGDHGLAAIRAAVDQVDQYQR